MESEGTPVKELKELYEKPYSLFLQFHSADLITNSPEIPEDLGDGDVGDLGDTNW